MNPETFGYVRRGLIARRAARASEREAAAREAAYTLRFALVCMASAIAIYFLTVTL